MMANPGFTFLQINICSLSDHSKTALNQYLQQTKADIVFPNETKTQISANLFDNFTIISSMGGCSGGVAGLLKNPIAYPRLNQPDDTSVDNVVLTVRLSGIKLVVSTAYVRPDDFEGLTSTKKIIQSCKTYVDKICLNGALFLVGDLNANIPIGVTIRVTCKVRNWFILPTTSAFSMMVHLRCWQQMATVLSISAFVMGLCLIGVNTLYLWMNLLRCSPVLHRGVMFLLS